MGLVEDHGLDVRQELEEAAFLHGEVCEQEMVVDDHEVGFLGPAPGIDHVTVRILRAVLSQAVVGRRRHERPDRRILGHGSQLGAVTAIGVMAPFANLGEVAGERRREFVELVEPVQAQVVGAAFEERRCDGPADGHADQGQISMIKLVLQGLGPGADDGLAAAHQGGQQVGEGLSRACAGLDDELVRGRDGLRHGLRHPHLAGAGLESRQQLFQGAPVAEKFRQAGHERQITRLRTALGIALTGITPQFTRGQASENTGCIRRYSRYNAAPSVPPSPAQAR